MNFKIMPKRGPAPIKDRLNRVQGQITAIERMIDEQEDLKKIVTQMQAAISGLQNTKMLLIQQAGIQKMKAVIHEMNKLL